MSAPLYIAFADGALAYDCAPCGACCRGLGIATLPAQVQQSPALGALALFVDPANSGGPLRSFFTYADGCRHLADDNLCELHRADGPAAKPLICRLFPFSRLVDWDGLWTLLPQARCPWRAGPSPLSGHAAIHDELGGLIDQGTLRPTPQGSVTPRAASERLALEVAIRDGLQLDALDGTGSAAIAAMAAAYHRAGIAMVPPPGDAHLWLDLLRCAGSPAPLRPADERLFLAAIPTLRVELSGVLADPWVPAALAALALYLRALAELRPASPFTGEDLLTLAGDILPTLRILALAESPIPPLPDEPPLAALGSLWPDLLDGVGKPLGVTLLAALRHGERGAVTMLKRLGMVWPATLDPP